MPTLALARWDKTYLWHPFTQQAEWAARDPILITSGQGVWLRDHKGRKLLDGNSSLWVNVWGHRHPVLDKALKNQIDKISHSTFLGLTHEPAIRLAKKLVELAPPGLSRVFYSDNGSTAVEVALKMAYQYWQLVGQKKKTRFVSLKEGYHGDTIGSVSVGGIDLFHNRFKKLLFQGWQVDPFSRREAGEGRDEGKRSPHPVARRSPNFWRPPAGYVGGRLATALSRLAPGEGDEMENILRRHHSHIAAVVMEPLIQGASGMLLAPRGYLAHVARLCKKYDVLLILDEVATGFGRTGTMFACEQEDVAPDFLCVAKSLTGGYLPLAATLAKEKIYRAFLGRYDEFKTFFHGHTYTANPLACAVALASLDLYQKKGLLQNVRARARQLAEGLAPLTRHTPVRAIRQVGLMAGIELGPYPPGARMGLKVCEEAIRRGVWLRPLGDVIVIMPPLAITPKELAFLIDVVRNSVILATNDPFD